MIIIYSIYGYFQNRCIIFERSGKNNEPKQLDATTIKANTILYYPNKKFIHRQRVIDFGLRIICALLLCKCTMQIGTITSTRKKFGKAIDLERSEGKKRMKYCYPKKKYISDNDNEQQRRKSTHTPTIDTYSLN